MTPLRKNSLEPVSMPGWRWAPFLNHASEALAELQPEPYPVAEEFLQQEGMAGSRANPMPVMTSTWGCRTKKLRQVRAACVEAGPAASVLNFVVNPHHTYDLPFFGADLVTLHSGHLLALDLQPALKEDSAHTQQVWERLLPLYGKWDSQLPGGGPIPEEAQPYFSPGFLWTRLPLDQEGDALISEVVMPAFRDYLALYLELVNAAEPVDEQRAEQLLAGQRRYTTYRAEKDPARGMLTRFHGSEWTEAYIHKVLFDL
ncbi:MAG: phycoerythrobilin:ferredoxin oxidoreductase [Prochlorococcus sp.]|nr:phycoerythrobilin:ferredoxin oxidoreductase [Prochlorococcaceae cyanobacterium Fu_MAG_50]